MKKNGLKRNTIDKFYTKKDIVNLCFKLILENVIIDDNDVIIEPSAGNGSFINSIKILNKNYKFYDIQPENDEIIKQDYLNLNIEGEELHKYNNIHIIGNPPFGRQSSLALKFIKKSINFSNCKTISFILPKSFKKDSLKEKIDLNYHCLTEIDLPKNSFLLENKEYDVPCVFQIWIKKDFKRKLKEKLIPKNFKFVKKNNNFDISFRRVGVYAGNICSDLDENLKKSEQSHYFIKFNLNINFQNLEIKNEILKKLKNIDFKSRNNTVGPKSISKQELICEYNKIL